MIERLRHAWSLAWPLARRDLQARYRGSVAGLAWALIAPLAMVLIYALVFQGIFKARWTGGGEGGADYALRLFAGLIVFNALSETATRATRLIQDNANLVKRVVFPLGTLVLALVMQVAVHLLVQFAVLGLALSVAGEGVRSTWLLLPLAVAWVLLLQLALGLALAALGCYVRDLQHLVPLVMTGVLFLSPVFYPRASAPEALQWLLQLNPLTAPIELVRAAWFGDGFDWLGALAQCLVLLVFLSGSAWLFERLRPGFADLV
ncbi:MAG: hypothetical protein AMXMBFR78_33090 [Rubrivivax sp.]